MGDFNGRVGKKNNDRIAGLYGKDIRNDTRLSELSEYVALDNLKLTCST